MAFNHYLWNLYLKAGGQETVDRFKRFFTGDFRGYPDFIADLIGKFTPDPTIVEDNCSAAKQAVIECKALQKSKNQNYMQTDEKIDPVEICDEYWSVINEQQDMSRKQWKAPTFYTFANSIVTESHILAFQYPGVFIPYCFQRSFNILTEIADTFDIELPPVPGKTQYELRCRYYGELCKVFSAFAEDAGLNHAELLAFLYDYAPSYIGGKDWIWKDLPEPHGVFVFGYGQDYPEKDAERIWVCQGNAEMQPGDIGLLYHWAPDRCYTSIWRAVAPGFYDPLFMHDRCVCYGNPIEIPRITYSELKVDEIFGKTPLVKTSMQRMDGAPMLPSEYMHLLEMAREKGDLSSDVPEFVLSNEIDHGELLLEHDVELQLLEPLLIKLGWTPANWITQMSVRAGRGEHKRPDYVINPVTTRNKERGEIVFEAKLTIPNKKQLEIDKGQARSYAKLLTARACVLVAKEGIWIMNSIDGYDEDTFYSWQELEDADVFTRVYEILGNRVHNKQKKHTVG